MRRSKTLLNNLNGFCKLTKPHIYIGRDFNYYFCSSIFTPRKLTVKAIIFCGRINASNSKTI